MAASSSLKRKAHAELVAPTQKSTGRSQMSKNSFTLEEAFKAWEKKQKNDSKNHNKVPPNLKFAGRRNHHSTVDNEGFIEPRKSVKITSANNSEMATPTTSNQYQPTWLHWLNQRLVFYITLKKKKKSTSQRQNNDENDQTPEAQKTNETSQQSTETQNAKSYRPPPIDVQGEKVSVTINTLRSINLDQETFIITMSKGLHSVQARNQTTYETIKATLKIKNIQFYTFPPRAEKLKSLLLKGMSEDITTDQVLKDLTEKNIRFVEFKKVTELKFKRDDVPKRHLIVQVTQTSGLKELFKIRQVLNLKARWERLRRNKVLQCIKCQRLGHTAANCEIDYRCVKCGNSHLPKQCPLNGETTRANFKCANCGQPGHPANYAGCKFIKFQKILKNEAHTQKSESLERKIELINRRINPQNSYANAMTSQRDSFPPLYSRNQTNISTFQGDPLPPPPVNTTSQTYRLQPQYHQQQTQQTNNSEPQQNWATKITNEISELTNAIKEMSVNLNRSITTNSRKINFLFAYLNLQYE
ncbi:Similar to ORF1: Nucleic-acid-binding protein from transposon X-element (Drosophila melanogaster) [Cotesia congregata]|uniref:Similar to ORF1: Nucleic-acid-binding protein from transposon X-element (Drosophila melanogaster) n=1 Tax=Cotesia congregata TaxID=51543 RepID=A0A8J2MWD4_COTCN|nr:Similar to ORF1: Nucleic-acid-binding protein from transposon X-element (Drosophila melanogaster) [Cotesia congregata]